MPKNRHFLDRYIFYEVVKWCLLDIYEDTNGFGRLHELNIKTYIATKSVKL